MPALEPLCQLIGIQPSQLSKKENLLLEAELLMRICDELKEYFRTKQKNYFHLMKFTIDRENIMLETNFIRFIIEDILASQEYSLQGISYYLDTHEDIVLEIIAGKNVNPSAALLRKFIALHRSVRPELYQAIIKKIFPLETAVSAE